MTAGKIMVAAYVLLMRGFPPLSILVSSIFLVQEIGETYGYVAYALSAFTLVANPLGTSFGRLVIREIIIENENSLEIKSNGVIAWANTSSIYFSAFVFFIYPFAVNVLEISLFDDGSLIYSFLFAFSVLGFFLVHIESSILRACGRNDLGVFFVNFLPWFLYICGIFLVEMALPLDFGAVALIFASSWIGVGFSLAAWRRLSSPTLKQKPKTGEKKLPSQYWWPFSFLTSNGFLKISVASLSIIYVERVLGIQAVLNLSVALQLSSVAGFVHKATIMQGLPSFAKLSFKGETEKLQERAVFYSRCSVVFSFLCLCMFYFLGDFALNMFYDGLLDDAYDLTLIFLIAQLVSCFFGPASSLLNMSGNSGMALKINLISSIVAVVFIFCSVQTFGLVAIAWGILLLKIMSNVLACWGCIHKLSVRCAPL